MPTPPPLPASGAAPPPAAARILLPRAPLLYAGLSEAAWITPDGEIEILARREAAERARRAPPLLCHLRVTTTRLGCDPFPALDLLELFAFVRPARFCAPTPRGLALALGLAQPEGATACAGVLRQATAALLRALALRDPRRDPDAPAVARTLARGGWGWAASVLAALGEAPPPETGSPTSGLAVWDRLPAWSERAPPGPGGQQPVAPSEARRRLAELLGGEAEARPQQADYASAVSQAFTPPDAAGEPRLVLAEAGTGVGKTLGYLAPASLWAEKNDAPVWISTFTRNLQHQIDGELDRLFPQPRRKAERVVVRKGRENYLCLLNYEDAVNALATRPQDAVPIGLLARWAAATRDGDMVGGDFPGWLADLLGRGRTLGLTDRRGECVYSACAHYGRCFIERGIRRARHAEMVVANHALVMIQAVLGGGEDGQLPTRYVFDEGHHVFAAADSAFAAHLSGAETQALRRWLLGGEDGGRRAGRNRGLRRRIADLIADDTETLALLETAERAARALPAGAWLRRLAEGAPQGPCEGFLAAVRDQVLARSDNPRSSYDIEAQVRPATESLDAAAVRLGAALQRLQAPLDGIRLALARRLDGEAEHLDSETRRRIEGVCRGLERRTRHSLAVWQDMLESLARDAPEDFVEWLAVTRGDGQERDVGMYRHWIDPTEPFARSLLDRAHGVVITSATLTDGSGDPEADWVLAERRVGAARMAAPAIRARVPSPFDYAGQTRVFVVGDLRKTEPDQIAAAYRELFLAAGGGALGLFTAIARLRAVHLRIGPALEAAGLALYAQHVDGMDTATLVDIFRAEENSCLLGTDAVRDGVDVPGRALRLIVFDRVPWPRPDIAHRARRAVFGGRAYDDSIARLRLRQAFGRLVRRADDHGVFVLLDPGLPSRLTGAFPEGVEVHRVGLAEAIAGTRAFLNPRKD